MEYKIGEVSKILNISKEMIRYYEKQGIWHHSHYWVMSGKIHKPHIFRLPAG